MLTKARTQNLDKGEVDFKVLHFSAHDDSVLTGLGKHNKECKWRIQAGNGTPLEIVVRVDKSFVGRPQVSIHCDKKQLFPRSTASKEAMKENFIQQWPFRGTAKKLNEKDVFEMRPEKSNVDLWYPATITKQREDGRLQVLAEMPNGHGGVNQVEFDAVRVEDLREALTKKAFKIPQRFIVLEVPLKDPLEAIIKIDDKEFATHFFARPTPAPSIDAKARDKVTIKVDKERRKAVADVGHVALSEFVSMEPRAVKNEPGKLRHSWTIRLGPWAEHKIDIEKRWKTSKLVTVMVDGEVLVESCAEDIECDRDAFECRFRFVGKRQISFEVNETNKDGEILDSKACVSSNKKVTIEAMVTMPDERNLVTAELFIDQVNFKDLRAFVAPSHPEENLTIDCQALVMSFGLVVPFKVNTQAPAGLDNFKLKAQDMAQNVGSSFQNFFSFGMFEGCCRGVCGKDQEIQRDIVEPHSMPKY